MEVLLKSNLFLAIYATSWARDLNRGVSDPLLFCFFYPPPHHGQRGGGKIRGAITSPVLKLMPEWV